MIKAQEQAYQDSLLADKAKVIYHVLIISFDIPHTTSISADVRKSYVNKKNKIGTSENSKKRKKDSKKRLVVREIETGVIVCIHVSLIVISSTS